MRPRGLEARIDGTRLVVLALRAERRGETEQRPAILRIDRKIVAIRTLGAAALPAASSASPSAWRTG
jgi:hypothetical protein